MVQTLKMVQVILDVNLHDFKKLTPFTIVRTT